jgi:hypothetical protein
MEGEPPCEPQRVTPYVEGEPSERRLTNRDRHLVTRRPTRSAGSVTAWRRCPVAFLGEALKRLGCASAREKSLAQMLELAPDRVLRGRRARRPLLHRRQHAREQGQLVGDDRMRHE